VRAPASTVTEPLILASKSPRRRDLLAQIGLRVAVRSVDVDETPRPAEPPTEYVLRVALAKGRAVRAAALQEGDARPVLAADTAVICDDRIFGKPTDAADAARMLLLLSDRMHLVFSGVALLGSREQTVVSATRVRFRRIDPAEADAYWATGEPRDKAGGYAVQGLGAIFVAGIEGSWSGVVGLPLYETAALLAMEGIAVLGAAKR
jgi:septum formation protein